jgi:type I restriction enzyme M protein
VKRDKSSLDLFWLRDESLEAADGLPAPEVLAASIVEILGSEPVADGDD